MKVAGFNLTKINAERNSDVAQSKVNSNIEVLDIQKEKFQSLREPEGLKVMFKHTIDYEPKEGEGDNLAGLIFEGIIILVATEDELKDITKRWKKKNLSDEFRLNLFNLVLRKCSAKALQLQEDLNIPTHIQIPKLRKSTTLET